MLGVPNAASCDKVARLKKNKNKIYILSYN